MSKPTHFSLGRLGTAALTLALLAACAQQPHHPPISQTASAQAVAAAYDHTLSVFHPVIAQNGMVATEHELASKIGLDFFTKVETVTGST